MTKTTPIAQVPAFELTQSSATYKGRFQYFLLETFTIEKSFLAEAKHIWNSKKNWQAVVRVVQFTAERAFKLIKMTVVSILSLGILPAYALYLKRTWQPMSYTEARYLFREDLSKRSWFNFPNLEKAVEQENPEALYAKVVLMDTPQTSKRIWNFPDQKTLQKEYTRLLNALKNKGHVKGINLNGISNFRAGYNQKNLSHIKLAQSRFKKAGDAGYQAAKNNHSELQKVLKIADFPKPKELPKTVDYAVFKKVSEDYKLGLLFSRIFSVGFLALACYFYYFPREEIHYHYPLGS